MDVETETTAIVGICVSDQEHEFLNSLIDELSGVPKLSIVCVQHLTSNSQSNWFAHLSARSSWNIVIPKSETILEPGLIYVCPSNQRVLIQGGSLWLESLRDELVVPSLIDEFFQSLGQDQGERAIGIDLSGDERVGKLGLQCISNNGGLAVSKDRFFDELNTVHFSSGDIVQEINRRVSLGSIPRSMKSRILQLSRIEEAIPQISDRLKAITDHSFHDYKTSTLARRIQRRMQLVRIADVEEYTSLLKDKPEEAKALFRDLLIGVTSFFRDAEAFDFLDDNVLSKLFENRSSQDTIRIWVAGCSTGEEAYTIAILCAEKLDRMENPPSVQIFASDIDSRALATARAGSYPLTIEEHVSQERLNRFFTKRGDRYHVNSEIRSLILFTVHNLTSDPPFSRLDLISCRNMMIYLGEQANDKLIPLFHYALNSGGYLVLGPSENISSHNELFETIDGKYRIARRKEVEGGASKVFEFRQGRITDWAYQPNASGETINWNAIRQQVLLEDFMPRSCIVDAAGRILNTSAKMEKYLTLNDGNFKNDIIAMVASGLKIGLRTALKEAVATRQKVQVENLTIRVNDKIQPVMLTVLPLNQVDASQSAFLVVFQDTGQPFELEVLEQAVPVHVPDVDKIISQLEAELETNRRDLDRSLQDMEATNEELKSSNEELLSMNEELQAANEELEASKDEILRGRLAVEKAHSDLQNLLRSTRIATIFLDNNLRICNFTPAISEIYELLSTDIGRPLELFVPLVYNMPALPEIESVRSGIPIEHTILAKTGKSFIRRVLPYESRKGDIEGMVITFHDVTELRASEAMFQSLVDASSQIVWVADASGSLAEDSPSWRAFTGQSLEECLSNQWLAAVHPEDRSDASLKWEAALQSGEVLNLEYRLWHHSGVWKWTHARAVAQRNPDGTIHRWVGMNTDITERKRWEIELRDRESHLRRVIDNTLCFVGVLDLNGVLLEANATAISAAGVQRGDVIGRSFWDCYWWNYGDPHVVEDLKQAIARARKGETVRYDVVVRMAGDTRMTVDFMLSPVRDSDGQITHLIPSGVDISQRKLAEQNLIEQANQLNLALDSGNMGMYEWEPETNIVYWDQRHLRLTGLPKTQMTGADFLKLVHPDDVEANGIAIEKTIRGESDYHTEFRIIRTDGQVRWLAAHGKIVKFDDGRPMRFVGLNWDITDQKQSEMTIKLNEDRLRNAAAAAGFAMMHGDLELGVITFSPEMRRLIGLPDDAPLMIEDGRLPDWVHPEDAAAFANHIQNSIRLKEDTSISLDHRVNRFDGDVRWMRLHTKPIHTGQVDHCKPTQWIGTLLDITQQKQFEESLKAARQMAEAANESKSLFLANMSHEIRTPMTAILGFAELLEDDDLNRDPALTADAVQTIRANASHLLSVINDILDMSKIEAGRMTVEEVDFSPSKLLEEIHALLGPRARGKGIELQFVYDSLMPEHICSDPTRLRQILLNLVGNAIKFTEIGSVTVHTSYFAASNRIQFRVMDTGVGMTPEQLEVVSTFQAFSQADASTTRQFGGTGLGLKISNTLASLLGGFISVESKPGKGSVFSLTIHTNIAQILKSNEESEAAEISFPAASTAEESAIENALPLKGMKILIAEDGPDNQKLISFHLRRAGADVKIAENGLIAVEMIAQAQSRFDLVLMDMQMPVLDGYQATRQLRNAGYTRPIVALTAHALDTDRDKCLEVGCNAFATKPIHHKDLIALVKRFAELNDGPR